MAGGRMRGRHRFVKTIVAICLYLQRVLLLNHRTGAFSHTLPFGVVGQHLLNRRPQGADVADLGQPARLAGTDHVGDAADVEASYLRI